MIPVEKNKTYQLEITSVSSEGNGVGHIDGYAVFVPKTVDGDVIECLIVKVRKSFAYGKAIRIIKPSQYRVEAPCGSFKRCGGCQILHIDYEHQKQIKGEIVNSAMQRIGGFTDFKIDGVDGLEYPFRYRNKMVFPVGKDKNDEVVCGFYAQRSHDIIPIEDCLAGSEINADILKAVKEYMAECNVSAYNEEKHNGVVRRIFIRHSHKKGEFMVVVSVNADTIKNKDTLINKLLKVSENIVSIILNINKEKTNLVLGNENITIYGKDCISDTLLDVEFEISPMSFYQINPVMTQRLYKKALEFAQIEKKDVVMDVYCGIGTISLCASKEAKEVIGVEIVKEAIENARENAKNNGIENARFFVDSAENIVPKLIDDGLRPNVVILDPPRKGSDEKTLNAIIKAKPERIVYVSCNPSTLARDARFLCDRGYKLENVMCYDLFPNTVHIESVARFTLSDEV